MFKRILAFFLVFALFVGITPINAFAQSKLLPVGEIVPKAEQQQITEVVQGNTLSIEIADVHRTYDGTSQKLSFKTNDQGVAVKGLLAGHTATFTINASGKNAGEYDFSFKNDEVIIKDASGNNVTAQYTANDIIGKLIIEKAATLRIVVDNKQISFGGEIPKLTYSVTGLVSTDTVKSAEIIAELSTDYKIGDSAGVYNIFSTPPTSKNYTFISPVSNGTLTVTAAKNLLSISADDIDKVYDGTTENIVVTPSIEGIQDLLLEYRVAGGNWTATAPSFKDVVETTVDIRATHVNYKIPQITVNVKISVNTQNYTVTYNLGGDDVVNPNDSSYDGRIDVTLVPPTRVGYTFKEWTATGVTLVDGKVIPKGTTGSITLTAVWEINSYTVTFNGNGGTPASITVKADYNTVVTPIPTPIRIGYSFAGWNTKADGTGIGFIGEIIVDNIIFYAQWVSIKRELTITIADVTATYTGISQKTVIEAGDNISGAKVEGLLGGDTITAFKVTASGKNAGEYEFVLNKDVVIKNGTKNITDQYKINIVYGKLIIEPALLSVTAVDSTVPRGNIASGFTVKYFGFVEGEDESFLKGNLKFSTDYTTTSPAGNYKITPLGFANTKNYAITFIDGTLTVTNIVATPLTITVRDVTKTYNGISQREVVEAGDSTGIVVAGLLEGHTLTFKATASGKNAGEYVFEPNKDIVVKADKLDVTAKYVITVNYGKLTVKSAPLTITAQDKTIKSGDDVPDFTAQYSGFAEGEDESFLKGTLKFSTNYTVTSPAGEYDILPSGFANTKNYTITFKSGKLTVTPATLNVTLNGYTGVYDATQHGITVTGAEGATIQYKTDIAGSWSATAPVFKDAGEYTVYVKVSKANYTDFEGNAKVKITARSITITVSGATKVYDGTALTANAATLTSGTFAAGETIGALNLIYSGSQTAVGSSTSSATTGNTNYNVTVIQGTLTVTARPITITVSSATKVYDGTALTANTAVLTTGTFAGSETIDTLNLIYSGSQTAVGSSACSATTGNTNYNVTVIPGTLTVTARPVTITVRDVTKTYNGTSQKIVTDGTGIDVNGLIEGYTLTFKATAKGKNVGEYSFETGEEPIIKAGETVVTDNYTIVISYGQLIIEPALLSITADNKTIVTGSDVPAFTAKYSGFVDGEDESFLKGTIKFSTDYTKTSPSGSYHIILSGFANTKNYRVAFTDGMLTVTDNDIKALTVTVRDVTKTYNGILQKIVADDNAGIDVEGLANGHVLTFKATAGGKNVGEYPFEVNKNVIIKSGKIDVTERYTVTVNYGKLTVEPTPLTITAQDKTILPGAAVPTFTAKYSDFAEGEDATFLKGKLNFSTEYTKTSPAGEYDVIPSGFEKTENYAITFVNGKLTVGAVANKYTVTFVDHKGNTVGTPQTVVSGSAATAPIAPERSGYYFKEWDKPFTSITADLTVTAVYDTWFEFTETSGAITITKYKSGAPNDVVIPAKFDDVDVLHIGDNTFKNNTQITSVIIPNSVITVGASAFYGCTALAIVSLGEGTVTIGSWAFYNANNLTDITFPANLTSIDTYAFHGCNNLARITFEDSAATIGHRAFYACVKISKINFGNKLEGIMMEAFSGSIALTDITFPESLTSIGEYAFSDCHNLIKITFEDSATTIGNYAFCYCFKLEEVSISKNIANMDREVFWNSHALKTIEIRNSKANVPTAVTDNEPWGAPATTTVKYLSDTTETFTVTFVSGGSAVPDALVNKGETVAKPVPDPTRSGYQFKHWSTTQDGATLYNFNTPVNEALTLYAVWTPAETTYSIIYWLEKADMGADDVGTDTTKYEFKERVNNQNSTSGQVINFTATELNKYDYFTYSHTVSQPLLGNGSSIVNVYFKRIVYTFVFDLVPRDPNAGPNHINYFTHNTNNRIGAVYTFRGNTYGQGFAPDGTAYNNDKYRFSAKLDMNVSTLWPYPNGHIIKTVLTSSYGGTTWTPHPTIGTAYSSRWYETDLPVTVPATIHYQNNQMDAIVSSVLTYAPKDKPGTITYKVNYVAEEGKFSQNIWLEKLPHETASAKNPVKTEYGKTYRMSDLTRDGFATTSSSYGPLLGFTPQHPYTSTTTGLVTEATSAVPEGTANNGRSRDYYLYRNRYTLSFNTGIGAGAVAPHTNIMFGEKSNTREPVAPIRNKYTFVGWYTNNSYTEDSEFDFATATMPAGNLELFAKWESNDNTITFYSDLKANGGVLINSLTQGVADGENVIQPANYIVGHIVPGFESKGVFDGWVKYTNNVPQLYSFESEVRANLGLYAQWRAVTPEIYTVTFVDHKGNTIGTPQTIVSGDAAKAPIAPERSGYHFQYWGKDDGIGGFVDATADLESITADLTIIAIYDTWFYFSENEGVITITGYKSGAPNDVVIPAKFDDVDVLHIGGMAFYYHRSLTSVIIPNGVTTIGNYAFDNCNSLTAITIPNSVTNIGWATFDTCNSLTTITIPDSVTNIDGFAFSNCTKLEEISISGNIESMPATVFNNNPALQTIEIRNYQHLVPTAVTDNEPWGAPVTTTVKYLNDITGTFTVTFVDHKGNTIGTPQTVESGNAATAPTGDAITKRSGYYFKRWDRPFTSVTANLTITAVYDTWFEFTEAGGAITITGYKSGAPNDVVIPAKFDDVDVLHIGEWAFNGYWYYTSITSVVIPSSIITIGDWAFRNCCYLSSVTIPDSVTAIGSGAFYDCESLISINIPNGVTFIEDYTFGYCYSLTTVTIPSSVTSIGYIAFDICSSLIAITIPDSVTNIGDYAFSNCTKLEEISISRNIESMPTTVFNNDPALKTINIRNSKANLPTAVTNNEPWGAPQTTVVKYLNNI